MVHIRVHRGMLAALICCLMTVAALAPAAFAEPEAYPVMVGGVQVTSENAADVLGDGSVRAEYDSESNCMALHLSDAQLSIESASAVLGDSGDAAAICADGVDVLIDLTDENAISGQPDDLKLAYLQGICVNDGSLVIEGPGALSIDVRDMSYTGHDILAGIYVTGGDVRFGNDGGFVSITCKGIAPPEYAYGICASDGAIRIGVTETKLEVGAARDSSIAFEADGDVAFANTMLDAASGKASFSCVIYAHMGDVDFDELSIATLMAGDADNESDAIAVGNMREYGVRIHRGSTIHAQAGQAPASFGIYSNRTVMEDTSALTALGHTRSIYWDLDLTNHTYCDAVANLEYDADSQHATRPAIGTLLATEESYYKSVFIRQGGAFATRIAGDSANETASAIARFTYGDGNVKTVDSEYVVLARDDDFADALGATGLAGVLHCPIVLTDRTALSPAARDAIDELDATKVYLIGGEGAMKPQLVDDLAAQCGITDVTRLWGEDCYDTSLACAEEIARIQPPTIAIAAMSLNFQDALSISPIAYTQGLPIILQTWGETAADRGFTDEARAFLADKELLVVGGTGAISDESLDGLSVAQRLWGETGYDTSLSIAVWAVADGYLSGYNVVIACGAQAPRGVDALAGSALAGKLRAPILLVNANPDIEAVNTVCTDELSDAMGTRVGHVFVLGGTYVVPQEFYEGLRAQIDAEDLSAPHLCDLVYQGAFDVL